MYFKPVNCAAKTVAWACTCADKTVAQALVSNSITLRSLAVSEGGAMLTATQVFVSLQVVFVLLGTSDPISIKQRTLRS